MTILFDNSAFADLSYIVSRGRFFRQKAEQPDYVIPEKYLSGGKDVVVDWDDEDDPENPYNWPFWYKMWITMLLYVMTMFVYMGSSIITCAACVDNG
ncbi:hypothetical protein MSPP1_004245 [Malassezia sp. CBS 17886]|nr:hypothetical protein MSPP1_004245 [Malassezia sp. CBS 17886]